MKIVQRKLFKGEISILLSEMKDFADIGLIGKKKWKKFSSYFVLTKDGEFAGVCAVVHLSYWVKIGPFVIRKKFQKIGLGRKLFSHVLSHYEGENLYIGSSNTVIGKLAEKSGFSEVKNFFLLPGTVKLYLAGYLITRISPVYLIDSYRKLKKRGEYRYFLKKSKSLFGKSHTSRNCPGLSENSEARGDVSRVIR